LEFDKKVLDDTVDKILTRIRKLNTTANELKLIYESLTSIQEESYPEVDEDGKPIMKTRKKKDMGTGIDMSDTRRDVIFDSNIPKANTIINKKI